MAKQPAADVQKTSGQRSSGNGRDHYLGSVGTKVSKLEYDRLISEWLSSGRSLGVGEAAEGEVA